MKSFYIYAISKANIEVALKEQLIGLSKKSKLLSQIRKGDEILFYQTGEGIFIAKGVISKEFFTQDKIVWPDEQKEGGTLYPYRLKVQPKPFRYDVAIERVLYGLRFIKNKKKYGGYLRTSLVKIPQRDYQKIILASKTKSRNYGANQALGNSFQNEVAKILALLGFDVINMGSKEGPDIVISDTQNNKKYKIIVQCKATASSKPYPTISKLIDEYATKARKEKAKLALIFLSNYTIKSKFDRLKVLKKDRVSILTADFLRYYEELYKKIGAYAKYQFLADIKADVNLGPNIKIPAILIKQNNYTLYVSSIDAEWLLTTCAVLRRITGEATRYQRILNTSRVKKEIPAFLMEDWVLPNNLVLATNNEKIVFRNNTLILPSTSGLFWVVDGQHRLYSFSNIPKELRKTKLICTILDTNKMGEDSDARLAKIFVDLNLFAKRVDPGLIIELTDIIGSSDPKLKVALNLYNTKTFTGLVTSYSKKGGSINLTTLATNSAMKTLTNPNGPLVESKTKDFTEIVSMCTSRLEIFFRTVEESFENIWGNKNYILSDNRGIRALLRFYLRLLKEHGSKKIDKNVKKAIRALAASDFDFSLEYSKARFLGEAGADELAKEWLGKVKGKLPGFAVGRDIKLENYEIPKEESEMEEFKSSLRWDINNQKESDELKYEVVRGVSALMNTEGGNMYIGVNDEGRVLGIEKDLELYSGTLSQKKDKFLRQLNSLISGQLGGVRVFDENIESIALREINGKLICVVSVKRSDFEVFFKKKLYRRFGSSSVALEAEDLSSYIKKRFQK